MKARIAVQFRLFARRVALTGGMLSIILGCGSSGSTTADVASPAATPRAASAPAAPAIQGGVTSYKGALPGSIETIDVADFEAVVANAAWSAGRDVDRDCAELLCRLHLWSTSVRIKAIDDAHLVDYKNLPPNGVLVARMRNLGNHKELRYQLPRGDDWFYVLFVNDKLGVPRMRLVRHMTSSPGAHSLKVLEMGPSVSDCGDGHKFASPDADFKDCVGGGVAPASSRSAKAWVSCSQGCCTSDFSI